MVVRQSERFTVRSDEELTELESCIADERFAAIHVYIPDGATALATAREFRRVLNAARTANVAITFTTDDPLRRELARIVGARLTGERGEHGTDNSEPTRRIASTIQQPPAKSSSPPPYKPFQAVVGQRQTSPPTDIEYERSDPSFSFVINPPSSRVATRTADLHVPPPTHARSERVRRQPRRKHRSARRHAARAIAVLLATTLVCTIAIASAIVVLPTATITLTPATHDVSATISYGVATPGQQFDISIPPQTIETTLSFAAVIPATGQRTEPDGTATGNVLMTNTSTVAVTVPAGTELAADGDVIAITTEEVIVPAADPFGTLTLGSVSVPVAATVAGPDGNARAESLIGQLGSGIYYSNREALSGGTVRHITTVSDEDLQTLRERARADLHAQAASAIGAKLAVGQQILDGTEQVGDVAYRFDRQAGDDAQAVRLDATLHVSAQVFSLDGIHSRASDAVIQQLTHRISANEILLRDTVEISQPQPVSGANGTAFTIHASARTRSKISETDIHTLKSDLVGLSPTDAMARIRQVPGIESVAVMYGPEWLDAFGERMPRLESRITVEVIDAERIQTQASSSGS